MSELHMRRLSLLFLLLVTCAGCMSTAKAATGCTATSTNIAFGNVLPSGMTDVSATFNVTCSTSSLGGNTKVRMCLNIGAGANGAGNFNPRQMLSGALPGTLQFQLYSDPARTQIWGSRGNAIAPNPVLADFDYQSIILLGGSQTRTFTIYGRIPFPQSLIAGAYSNPFTGIHTSIEYRYNESVLTASYPASCAAGGTPGTGDIFPFTATATVPPNCRAYITTDLDFGSVPGLIDSNLDQTSIIGMTCTSGLAWKVGLNNGNNPSGNIRRMRLGATTNYVAYELYSNPGRTTRWGNTINIDTVPGTGNGAAQSLTVYGRVPATQNVAAGSYSDIITVTVTY